MTGKELIGKTIGVHLVEKKVSRFKVHNTEPWGKTSTLLHLEWLDSSPFKMGGVLTQVLPNSFIQSLLDSGRGAYCKHHYQIE